MLVPVHALEHKRCLINLNRVAACFRGCGPGRSALSHVGRMLNEDLVQSTENSTERPLKTVGENDLKKSGHVHVYN